MEDSSDIPSLFEKLDGFENYHGLGQNVLFADTAGNIGYYLVMSVPERKDETPFVANRVLDGTKSDFDWTGKMVPLRSLPKSLNPKKGYIVTANGRQTSDHARLDHGASVNSPARMIRIDEVLRDGIANGRKFTLEDMGAIQQDVVDVVARRMAPKIASISQDVSHHLTKEQKNQLEEMLQILAPWEGSFDESSIGASVYSKWYA